MGWATLISEITSAIAAPEQPEGPAAQRLLDRWLELLRAATGADAAVAAEVSAATPFKATPELREALWARRGDWMPADAPADTSEPLSAQQARARAEQLMQSLVAPEVVELINRTRAARR